MTLIRQKQAALSALGLGNENLYRDSGATVTSTGAIGATILVTSTANLAPSGSVLIAFLTGLTTLVSYTGVTGSPTPSLTGCTGGTGTLLGTEHVVIPPTPGLPVSPVKDFLPQASGSMEPDPGEFEPELMMGVRDASVFPLSGQAKYDGAIAGPVFPSYGAVLLAAGIGQDGAVADGVAPASSAGSLTLTDASDAGAIALTLSAATGITAGTTTIMIDVNDPTAGTTQECRLVKTLNGLVATVNALQYAHAASVPVKIATGPFTHSISMANMLPPLTVEQQVGGPALGEAMQFAGTLVDKLEIKVEATNAATTMTGTMKGQHYASLPNADMSPLVFPQSGTPAAAESPFTGFQGAITFLGVPVTQAKSCTITIENAVAADYCAGDNDPAFLTATTRKVSGTINFVWNAFTNTDTLGFDYVTKMMDLINSVGPQVGTFGVDLVNPATGLSANIAVSQAIISKDKPDLKATATVQETVSFKGLLDLTNGTNISATIVSNVPDAY